MYLQSSVFVKVFLVILVNLFTFSALSQVTDADKTVCSSSTSIGAIPSGGVWSTSGNASIVSPSSQNTAVNNLDPGPNTFTYTSGAFSDNIIVTNNAVSASLAADYEACSSSAVLNGSAIPSGGTGEWKILFGTTGVIIDNTASAITNAYNLPFGSTTFEWTVSANGCTASDEINITNNIALNTNGTDQAECTNTFYIGANSPPPTGSGSWTNVSGPGVTFDNSSSPGVQIIAPIGSSTIRWTITYNGCLSSKDFIVTNNLPNPKAGKDSSICVDDISLYADALLPGETGQWSVIGPQAELFSNTADPNSYVNNIKQGTTTFEWKITNAFCNATDLMQVINNRPDVNAGPDETICDSLYTFNANNPNPNSGVWTCSNPSVVFDNTNLYNATASKLENDIYNFTWEVSNGSCTATDNIIITSDYVTITAGNDINDCSNTFVLNATAVPAGGSGYWTLTYGEGSIDNSLSANTTARNISEISHFKWTINSGACTYDDEIVLINQLPTQAVTNADKAVCENQTQITANPIGTNETGTWSVEGGGGANIISPSLFQTQVSNLDAGTNTFKWTIDNQNCQTEDLITVTNNQINTYAGADETICATNYNLNASLAGGTGYWTCPNTSLIFSNSTNPQNNVSNFAFGANTLIWTRNDLGCTTSDTVLITNNLPADVFAGTDQVVCEDNTTLSANNPTHGVGVWTTSGIAIITNPTLYQTEVNGLSPGINTFRWTVSYGSCASSADVDINNNRILVDAGSNKEICNVSTTNLSGTAPNAFQTGLWSVVGGNGVFANSSIYNTDVSNLVKGINTFRWTLSDGVCANSDEITITNNTPDPASAEADKGICSDNVEINAIAVTNGSGSWSVSSGSGTFDQSNNNNTFARSIGLGPNIFTWTVTKNNCSLSDDVIITNNSVNAQIEEVQINICDPGHSTTIEAIEPIGPGVTGIWTKLSVGSGIIQTPSNYQTVLTNLANGDNTFRWTLQNGSCSSFDEIKVTNNYYTATANPVGASAVCVNYIGILGNAAPSGGTGKWNANTAQTTFDNSASANTYARNLPAGITNLTWTIIKDGCAASTNFNVTNNSLAVSAGSDIVGCATSQVLNADYLSGTQTGQWTANNASVTFVNANDPKTTANNILMGTSLLTWTISANGCSANDDMVLINNAFTVTAGANQTICATAYTLSGSDPIAPGTGFWEVIQGGGTIANSLTKTTSVSNLPNGTTIFRWTVTRNSCVASADVSITNDLYVAQASAPSAVCIDEVEVTAQSLPGGSGATGIWSTLLGGGVFDNVNDYVTTVRGLSIGSNRFRWTVTKGLCQSYVNIDVLDNRVVVSAGTDQVTCDNYTSLFASPLTSTGTGLWTCDIGTVNIESPTKASTNIASLQRGINTFTWTVNDNGCTGDNSITVTNNSFDANAGTDQEITVDNITLNADLPSGASGTWSILSGNASFSDIYNPSTTANNIGYGVNDYRWSLILNGCTAYDDVKITYNVAESYAGGDYASCNNYATLNADQPIMGTGIWSIVQGNGTFQNTALYNTQVTDIPRGLNIYRWTVTAFGSSASDDVTITNNSFDIYAGEDQQTCDTTVILSAESAGSGAGIWEIYQGSGYFSDSYLNTATVTNMFEGENLYIWTVTRNACVAKDTVLITHYQPVTVANAGTDAFICDNNEYQLIANQPIIGTGTWSATNTDLTFDLPNQYNSMVRNLPNGPQTIWWTISNQHCQTEDNVIISSWNTAEIISQPVNKEINEGAIFSFTIETTGDVASYQWQKDGINLSNAGRISGADSPTLIVSNAVNSDQGNYQCIVTGYCNNLLSENAALSVISGFEELSKNGIKMYPNPSNGVLHIDFDELPKISSLSIYQLNGTKVLDKNQLSRKEILDLRNSSDGTYIIIIQMDNKPVRGKFIIRK